MKDRRIGLIKTPALPKFDNPVAAWFRKIFGL